MANKKHTFDFEGILSMGIDQKNWKDIKQKLEAAFGELKIGIQEGMAEVEAQKFVEIFNKVLSKAKLPEIGVQDLRKNFEQVSQSIEKAVGLINNIDTSVLKGIETTLERVADRVDIIADKMNDIGPKKGSMDNLTKEIKEAEDELAKLAKQKEAIERSSRAKSFNKEEGSILSAITRLTKNGKIVKSKSQGLLKSLNYKAPKNSVDLNERMADVQQEYNGAKTWEQQYAALLKYKKLYDSYISHDIKLPDEFAKIGEYTAQQIEDAIPYIQNSLQNVFNVAQGKGFVAEVSFEVPNPITVEDITGGKHKLKVEVEPSAKELKGTIVYRTIYMPEDEDDTRSRKEILEQWGGAEIWTSKKEVAETYAEGQENPTMLKGTISSKNAYIIDAGGKMWDQFQSMKVLKPDTEDSSKFITTNLKDEFPELFKRVANKEFLYPEDIQAELNEEIKKLGHDVIELRNVIDTNNPDSYKALSTTYSVLDDSVLQVDSASAMHSQDRDGITTFEKKASKDNIPKYYKMPDAVSAEMLNTEVEAQKQITEELEKQNKLILIRRVEGEFDPNRIGNRSLDALYDKQGNPQIQDAMEDGLAGYGDGLFGSVVSSAKNLIPELLTGEIDTTDKTSYFEFDVSDYNMFINHTAEQSERLRQFLLSLQKLVGAGTILDASELTKIADLSNDQLYEQAQQIFKDFGMTKEQFNAWLENAKKESAEIAKLFKQGAVPENRHNFGTRFMQSLGYEGVLNQTGDDEYDGNTYGSVVFDPDTDKIRQGLTNGMQSWNGVEEYCKYLGVEIKAHQENTDAIKQETQAKEVLNNTKENESGTKFSQIYDDATESVQKLIDKFIVADDELEKFKQKSSGINFANFDKWNPTEDQKTIIAGVLEEYKRVQQAINDMPLVETEDDKKRLVELQTQLVSLGKTLQQVHMSDVLPGTYAKQYGLSDADAKLLRGVSDPNNNELEQKVYDGLVAEYNNAFNEINGVYSEMTQHMIYHDKEWADFRKQKIQEVVRAQQNAEVKIDVGVVEAEHVIENNKEKIQSYKELSSTVSRYIELAKSLIPIENNTEDHQQITRDMNRLSGYELPDDQQGYIDTINNQKKNIDRIKSAIKAGAPSYTDTYGDTYNIMTDTLDEAERKLRSYIYHYAENFDDIGKLVDGAKTKALKDIVSKESGKFKADVKLQEQQEKIAEAANKVALKEMEQVENILKTSAPSEQSANKVSKILSDIKYSINDVDRYTQSSQTDYIADQIGVVSPHKEIQNNAEAIQSYEELCAVVERYNELQQKRFVFAGGREPTLSAEEENEYAKLYGRLKNTREGVDIYKLSGFRGIEDIKKLSDALGIEIPQAAQKAQQAVADVNNELKTTGDKADNINTSSGTNFDTKPNLNVDSTVDSKELVNLEAIRAKVVETTTAVNNKTAAFTAEETEVQRVVNEEVAHLGKLEDKIQNIKTTLEGLMTNIKTGEADIGAGLSNIVVNVNHVSDNNQLGQTLDKIYQAISNNKDLLRQAQSMTLKEFLSNTALSELKQNARLDSEDSQVEYWKNARYNKDITFYPISKTEAKSIINDKIPESLRNMWYFGSNLPKDVRANDQFAGRDIKSKNELESLILGDDTLRNAAINYMWHIFNQNSGTNKVGFQDFLNTPRSVYRGLGDNENAASGELRSFSFDKNEALLMVKGAIERVVETTIKPRDTVGYVGPENTEREREVWTRTHSVSADIVKDAEKTPWALDETLKGQTNAKLDEIKRVLDSINSQGVSAPSTDIGNVLATESTLGSIKKAVEAINAKIVKGTKASAGNKGESVGKKSQKAWNYSASSYFPEKLKTQTLNLAKFRAELMTTGRLTDDVDDKIYELLDGLKKVNDGPKLSTWNEKFKQLRASVGINTLFDKADDKAEIKTYQELISFQKIRNQLELQYEQAKDGSETKRFYAEQLAAMDSVIAKQQIIGSNDEYEAKLVQMRTEHERKLAAIRAKQVDKEIADGLSSAEKEEEAAVKRLIKQYELLGTMRAEADAATSGEFKNYLEGRIAEQEKLIAEASSDVYIDGNRQRELDLKADAAYYAQRQKLEEKAIKERDAAEKKSRVKALKDNINEEIKLAKKTAMTDKAGSAANRAANTYIGALSSDVALPKEFNSRLEEYKKQIDELRSEQARVNALSDPKLIDAETDSLNKKTAALNRQTQELNEQIAQYQKYNVDGAIDMGTAAISPDTDLGEYQRQLTALVKQHHDGKVSVKGFNEQTKELVYTVQQRGSKAITTYNAAMTELDGKVRSVAQSTKMAEGFFDALKRKMNEIKSYVSAMSIISFAIRQIKQGIQYVKEIDLAMTELRKVTDETAESYEKFMDTASKTAAKVGSTMRDVISSTADWARLGYSLQDAATLAESTQILMNVSEFTDVSKATDSLISSIQAFKYTANQSMEVVDILNTIGKHNCRNHIVIYG